MRLNLLDLFSGIGGFSIGLEATGHFRTVATCETDPFCRRVLARHWPGVPAYVDVRDLSADRLREDKISVDAICGGFPCFPSGTIILSARGMVDISEIVVGDMVLTHLGRWRRVTETYINRAPIVSVRGLGQPVLRTTREHPFYVLTDRTSDIPDWIEAGSLRKGMLWASPTVVEAIPSPKIPVIERSSDEVFYWAVGRWLADGWCVSYKRTSKVQHGRGSRKNSFAKRIYWCCSYEEAEELGERLRLAGFHVTRDNADTAVKFVVQFAALFDYLVEFDRGAANKRLPSWVYGLPEHCRKALLEGWISGDGTFYSDSWRASSISKRLAIGMRLLALGLGWSVALYYCRHRGTSCLIEGRTVNQQGYHWELRGAPWSRQGKVLNNHFFGPIRSVVDDGVNDDVFNFAVEDDESYIADGIVVHNCIDVSNAGHKRGLDGGPIDGRGDRGGSWLWGEYARLVREVRPRVAFVENVAALAGRGLDRVLGDLAEVGYDAVWCCVPASRVGALHERDRMWIVAYPSERGRVGSGGDGAAQVGAHIREAPDPDGVQLGEGSPGERHGQGHRARSRASGEGWTDRGIRFVRALSRALDAGAVAVPDEPLLVGAVHGLPRGVDGPRRERLRVLGNAVVPQVVTAVGRAAADCGILDFDRG